VKRATASAPYDILELRIEGMWTDLSEELYEQFLHHNHATLAAMSQRHAHHHTDQTHAAPPQEGGMNATASSPDKNANNAHDPIVAVVAAAEKLDVHKEADSERAAVSVHAHQNEFAMGLIHDPPFLSLGCNSG
jgi:hypothetical protein